MKLHLLFEGFLLCIRVQDIAHECHRQHPAQWPACRGGAACEEMYMNLESELDSIQNYDALSGHPIWHNSTSAERLDGLIRLGDGNLSNCTQSKLLNNLGLYKRMLGTAGRRPNFDPPMLLSSGGTRLGRYYLRLRSCVLDPDDRLSFLIIYHLGIWFILANLHLM